MDYNYSNQNYNGIILRLIKRDYKRYKAKRFLINNSTQNIWIPNQYLEDDGTIKRGANLSFIFNKNEVKNKINLSLENAPLINSNGRNYAGIGSRSCPEYVLEIMESLGEWLGKKGFTLRSGGADGSDKAFEKGADKVKGLKEIYIPWRSFNGSSSSYIVRDKKAFEIAKKYHPSYDRLSDAAKKLMARNSHQILGQDLNSKVMFVICYTKNGKDIGGTSQALRIARDYNIPIFNIGNYNTKDETRIAFKEFYNSLCS